MVRGRRRRRRPEAQRKKRPPAIPDLEETDAPEYTTAPSTGDPSDVLGNQPLTELGEETSLPALSSEWERPPAGQTAWDVIGHYVSGRLLLTCGGWIRLSLVGWLVAVVWTFIHDNAADKLVGIDGLLSWAGKAGLFLGALAVVMFVGCVVIRLTRDLE